MVQRLVPVNPSAEYIVAHADRLITVATRCVFSFGSADGLNDLLLTPDDPHGDWRQPVSVLHRDALMMAALRVSILLDRDDQMLSFQAIHRLLPQGGGGTFASAGRSARIRRLSAVTNRPD
jgi:hypothetical protein